MPESARDVDTKIDVKPGDRIIVNAEGMIWAGVWLTSENDPAGWDKIENSTKFPLPGSRPFSLLGKLDGKYFYIGKSIERIYNGPGSRLYLRINDDVPGNGSGEFKCHIQVWRG